MVAFLAQELVWGIFTECKLCNTAMAAQFGDRLGPISCFLKVLPFPSYRGGSVMATWVHFPSGTTWMPLFSDHFSTPLVSESATTLLPSSAVFPPRRGNWAAQDTNVMEGEPEASHGFTQYSWIAQSLEQLEVANTQGDAIVGRKEVMCNLLCQQRWSSLTNLF